MALESVEQVRKTFLAAIRTHPHLGIGSDPEWVSSYIALRQFKQRVEPQQLVDFHNSRKVEASHAGYAESKFVGIPRENFPSGLPPQFASMLADQDRLQELEARECYTIDRQKYYILDGRARCLLDQLGDNAEIFVFRVQRNTVIQNPRRFTEEIPDQANSSGTSVALASEDRSTPTLVAEDSTRALNRLYSEDEEPPARKKARLQIEALQLLKDRILGAAEAGKWAADKQDLARDSVRYYVGETLKAIQEIGGKQLGCPADIESSGFDGPTPCRDIMAEKFSDFFVKLVYNSPCYPDIRCFGEIPPQLYAMGAVEQKESLLLISALTKTSVDGDELPETGNVSVFARTPFEDSKVHRSFVDVRVQSCLERAAEAKDARTRCDILRKCAVSSGRMSASVVSTFKTALDLFDEVRAPLLTTRGKLLTSQPGAAELAKAWDATGPVGALAAFLDEAPDVKALTYETFRMASLAAASLGSDCVKNPAVRAAVVLIDTVHKMWGDVEWARDLCEHAVTGRLRLVGAGKVSQATTVAVPREHAVVVLQKVRPFVEVRSKCKSRNDADADSQPQWYVALKQVAEAEEKKTLQVEAENKRKLEAEADAKQKLEAAAVETKLQGAATDAANQQQGTGADSSIDARGTSPATISTDVQSQKTPAVKNLVAGQRVRVDSVRKSDLHGFCGTLERELTNHWYVKMVEGPLVGNKTIKLEKSKLLNDEVGQSKGPMPSDQQKGTATHAERQEKQQDELATGSVVESNNVEDAKDSDSAAHWVEAANVW